MAKPPSVADFMVALEHPLKPLVEWLRATLLAANPALNERIKWNAPSFGPGDEDRITLMLRDADKVRLIFHRGATAEVDPSFHFSDPSGLLDWVNNERGIVIFHSLAEAQAAEAALTQLARAWLISTAQ